MVFALTAERRKTTMFDALMAGLKVKSSHRGTNDLSKFAGPFWVICPVLSRMS